MKKEEKGNKKKILKAAGNLVTILAVLFVIRKLMGLDIDYSTLANAKSLVWILVISVIYGIIIVVYGWPWSNYVKMITHTRLPYPPVAFIMAKSNLLKYIPGNVFQYIGRNELAIRKNLKHSEVGMATIFDVATNLLAAAILGCVFYFDGFKRVLAQFGAKIAMVLVIAGIAVLLILVIVWIKKRALIMKYVSLLKSRDNLFMILANLCFYALNMFVNAALYIVTLICILNMELHISDIYVLMGAFMLSWIVGFIVPGAPGGIGIREFIITLLVPADIDAQMILFGIVVYRLINILGDIFGFLFTGILNRCFGHRDESVISS